MSTKSGPMRTKYEWHGRFALPGAEKHAPGSPNVRSRDGYPGRSLRPHSEWISNHLLFVGPRGQNCPERLCVQIYAWRADVYQRPPSAFNAR